MTEACTTDIRALYEWQAICNARIFSAKARLLAAPPTNATGGQEIPQEQPLDWSLLSTGVPSTANPVSNSGGYVDVVWGTTTAAIPDNVTIGQLDNPSWKASIVPGLLPTAALGLNDTMLKHTLQGLLASAYEEWRYWAGFDGSNLSKDEAVMLLSMGNALEQMGGTSITTDPIEAGPSNPDGPVTPAQSAKMPSAYAGRSNWAYAPSASTAPYPNVIPLPYANSMMPNSLPASQGLPSDQTSQPFPDPSTVQYQGNMDTNMTAQREQQIGLNAPFIALPFTTDMKGISYSASLNRLGNTGAFAATAAFPNVPENRFGQGYSTV